MFSAMISRPLLLLLGSILAFGAGWAVYELRVEQTADAPPREASGPAPEQPEPGRQVEALRSDEEADSVTTGTGASQPALHHAATVDHYRQRRRARAPSDAPGRNWTDGGHSAIRTQRAAIAISRRGTGRSGSSDDRRRAGCVVAFPRYTDGCRSRNRHLRCARRECGAISPRRLEGHRRAQARQRARGRDDQAGGRGVARRSQ